MIRFEIYDNEERKLEYFLKLKILHCIDFDFLPHSLMTITLAIMIYLNYP